VVEGAGVHGFDELHDGDGEVGVASEDGRFDGGGAAVFGQEGRVDVEDAFGLEKVEDV